jgi:outer membrane protein OmpA-like peptidoglycan-associated protein
MRLRSCLSLAFALAAAAVASEARAQTQTFAVDRLMMAGAPGDGIAVWRPDVAEKTRFFGQLGLGITANPLRTQNYVDNLNNADAIKGNLLPAQFITYVDIGAEILNRVSVQVALPIIAYQAVNTSNTAMVLKGANFAPDPNPAAVGDTRLDARVVVYRNEARSFKLGLQAAAVFPTGNKFSFGGDGGIGGIFGFGAEYDAKVVAVTLNAAYRLRPTIAFNELVVSSEVIYGLGAYVPLRRGTIRLGAEFFGGFGASPSTAQVNAAAGHSMSHSNIGRFDAMPLEWMLNAKMFFTQRRQVYAGLGGGGRLDAGYAPDFRGVFVVGGSFGVTDSDPRSPGARYVFDPGDTVDTDHDGIPDSIDACPNEPGELDPDPERIGCPRYIRRAKGSDEIEVLKRIEFEFDKSTILPESFPILDEVVSLLQANPTIKRMSIEGHTDNQGTPEYNQRLSDDRAHSVLDYMVKKGIPEGRLTAKGYGLTKPRATNDTDEGRQQNRRVEFHIIEQTDAPKK